MKTTAPKMYSPIPAIQNFLQRDELDPSVLEICMEGMLKTQMTLSRIVQSHPAEDKQATLIHEAMNYVASVYDEFQIIQTAIKEYDIAMNNLKGGQA